MTAAKPPITNPDDERVLYIRVKGALHYRVRVAAAVAEQTIEEWVTEQIEEGLKRSKV